MRADSVPEVISGHITSDNNEDILVFAVKNGYCDFGVCKTGSSKGEENFCVYMHDEPILSYTVQSGNEYSDIVATGYESMTKISNTSKKLDDVYKEICSGTALEYALTPFVRLLSDGLYAVTIVKTYPTDGGSMFFWSGQTIPKHLRCSGKYVSLIPKEKTYTAPYILPSMSSASYSAKNVNDSLIHGKRGDDLIGISYHIGGLYSVLLRGHYSAAAAVTENLPFYCVQIQPVRELWKVTDENGKQQAIGFSSASCRIPFAGLNRDQLRSVLAAREYKYPRNYRLIKTKMATYAKKQPSSRTLPAFLNFRCEAFPDADMTASAQGISELTRPMLDSLLSGLTSYNGKVIISENLYSSITAACNYLRYRSMDEFFDFAVEIMHNPDLAATYSYVTQCLSKMHEERVKAFFKEMSVSNDPVYANVMPIVKNYLENYDKHIEIEEVKDDAFNLPSLTKRNRPMMGADGATLIASHVSNMMSVS